MKPTTLYFLLLFSVTLLPLKGFAQLNSSLHLIKDNFYSQLMNPSYYSKRNKIELGLPGFAGSSLFSAGNFAFSDIVVRKNSGRYNIRGVRFAETQNQVNRISQSADIPLFFITIPMVDGALTIYWNEHIRTGIAVPINTISWIKQDNLNEPNRQFNSGVIGVKAYWNHEVGLSMAQRMSDRLVLGGRFKFLFNEVYAEIKDWSYTVITGELGKELLISAEGDGYISGPVQFKRDQQRRIEHIRIRKEKYKPSLPGNPGAALDLGFTLYLDPENSIAASVKNLGFIWLRHKTFHVHQEQEYYFEGMDFTHSLDPDAEGYISTLELMQDTKEELRQVFQPVANATKAFRSVTPEISMHYQRRFSEYIYAGLTNHTVFHQQFKCNSLSMSGMRRSSNFDILANLTLHGIHTFTTGAGLQWRNSFSKLFVLTDNLLAFYHPAAHNTFSLTFGIHLLLNNKKRLKLWDNSRKQWNNDPSKRPFYDKELLEEEGEF